MSAKWDCRYMEMARMVAGWSKDPSTQVGAVIVRPDNTVASLGFNGFPRGVADDERLLDRDKKYPIMIHAEKNAILSAHERLNGYTLYVWPLAPCTPCAATIIQAGIARVVTPHSDCNRWKDSCTEGYEIMIESGITIDRINWP